MQDSSRSGRSMLQLWLVVVGVTAMMVRVGCESVYMTLSSTSLSVGTASKYTISFNRSLNTLGQVITPSPLEANYQIAIIFDASYSISSSFSLTPSNYSISGNTATLFLTQTISTITASIINPYPSQTPLKITLNFYNASSPANIIDTCSATLSFQALTLASSAMRYQFSPGNVSTQSNLTVSFIPYTWDASKFGVQVYFYTYWARNMLNVSSNQVLNTMTFCVPTCSITNMGNFYLVTFLSLTLSNSNITFTINNILSPATLELADTISISVVENTYGTDFQSGELQVSAGFPNNLQVLTTTSTSLVGSQMTLTLSITTQDLFSSSDSIIVVLNTSVAMASQVTVTNILVASSSYSVQQNSIITVSNFLLVTNIPGQFSGSITISNISAQQSVKPVTGNKISFSRNGYLYDQSEFSFAASQASISSIALSLASNQANANTNLTVSISLSIGVGSTDLLYATIDQAIAVSSCNILSCSNCTCGITAANPSQGIFSTTLRATRFSTTTSIVMLLGIKNPISSNYVLYFTTTDQSNFTKEVGSQSFPSIVQSVIPSSIFSFSSTSSIVYQPTNFTLSLNFTSYTLLNGHMTILFDPAISLLNPSNKFCLVNGNNGACSLTETNGSILANITISSGTFIYSIIINNLRNPVSTQFFNFQVSVADTTNLPYYTLLSNNYQAGTALSITPQVSSSNCTNSASNIIAIAFPFLPFLPIGALVIDDPSAKALQGESVLKKIIYPLTFSSNLSLSVTNYYSLQPTYYQLLVTTNDSLYNIFTFNFTVTNCNPNNLPISSFSFTGLPQNSGTLTFTLNQVQVQSGSAMNGINFLTLTFPSQYSSNISISSNAQLTNQLGPRYFNLSISNTQPITVSVWGFTNVIGSAIVIDAFSFSQAGSFVSYQIASNANTVQYNLTVLTNCTFPCKICSSSNNSACLQCYSSATTQFYFYDPVAYKCVDPSSCSSTTFPNATLSSCVSCPIQCSTCTSLTYCQSCAANYFLLNRTCLTDCPSGYYPINPSQICAPCDSSNNSAHCSTCITLNLCSTCLYPYYLDPASKTCVVSCASSQIPVNDTCFACNSYCTTCQTSVLNCTSCVATYYLLQNACIASCPSPYVPSTTTNICVNCSSTCLLCTNTPTTCTSCHYSLKLLNSNCINDCPVGYYTFSASNNTLQCLSCLTQCASCSSQSICTSCVSGFHFYLSSCLLLCPSTTFSQNVTNNSTVSLVCSPCSSNCITCSSSSVCSQCQSSYYLTTNSNQTFCTSACNAGEYLNGNVCQQCSSNCLNCLNSSICLVCTTSYSLQNSQCVSNCSAGSVSILSNSITYVCRQCNQIYQYCMTCISSACTFCSAGFVLNFDRTCVVICPNGYVNVSNTCVSCSPECKACVNTQSNCSSCNQGYIFYQNTTSQLNRCMVNCPVGTFNSSGVCTACVSPCLTCVNSSTLCLTCMAGFYSFNNGTLNCVSSCPSSSYVQNSQCIFCSSLCSACDANGCLSCFPQYYTHVGSVIGNKTYYDCHESCPSSLPFLINNTCSQCALNCQICTDTSCLQCDSGFYGYQQYCLKQCPPTMVPTSGICTAPQNTTSNSTQASSLTTPNSAIVPIPFSICCIILILVIFISKLAHSNTSISIAVFSLASFLAIICNLYYLAKAMSSESIKAFSVLLIIGLLINYVNNIIFVFVSRHTLLKDTDFSCWKRGNVELIKEERIHPQPSHDNLQDHLNSDLVSELNDDNVPKRFYTYQCVWYMITTIGFFSSHNLYTLVFSQLFDLSIFKATVQTVKNLKILNYVSVVAFLAHLICLVSGIIEAATVASSDPLYTQHVYKASDLIFLNALCIILGLLLLRKKRELWEKPRSKSVGDDANSTKKVIFDHQSHEVDMNKDIESQSEVNGKIKNLFGTENGGSEHAIVGASYKSSTNQQGSDLYFQKEDGQNLDNSEDIKMENNIIWMQINPDEMMPQLVEKNESIVLEQSELQPVDKAKSTLNPDNNLDVLNFDKIQANEEEEEGEEQQQQSNEDEKGQNNRERNSKRDDQEEWQDAQQEEGDGQLPKGKDNLLKNPLSAHQNDDFIKIEEEQQKNLPQIQQDAENSDRDVEQAKIRADNTTRMSEPHSSSNLAKSSSTKLKITNQLKSSEPVPKNIEDPVEEQHTSQYNVDNNERYQDNNDDEQLMEMQKTNETPAQQTFVTLQADEKVPINTKEILNILENTSQDYTETPQFSPQTGESPRREIKTQQGRRQRRQKKGHSRHLPKIQDSNDKSPRQSHGSSSYYDQFSNQYQSSPKAQQLQEFLGRQNMTHNIEETHSNSQRRSQKQKSPSPITKENHIKSPTREAKPFKQQSPQRGRYKLASKYDPIKEQANELRMSNSTHNFGNTQQPPQQEDFSSNLYHNQEHSHIDSSLNYNGLPKSQQLSEGELKRSFYKSINIAKINNRLGSLEPQGRAASRDHQSHQATLKTDRVTSLPKNNLSSVHLNESRQSTFSKRQAWKSRTIHGAPRDNLDGTAKTIEKKARLAEVKAKLESIYLPPK